METANLEARPAGAALAAFLAAGIAVLVLGLVQVRSEQSESFKERMQELGSAWIPNAEGIGPYSGKETVYLSAWLASWLVLHLALRNRDPDVKTWFGVSLALLAVGVLLLWPPVWELFVPG